MVTEGNKFNSRTDAIKHVLEQRKESNYRFGQICSFIFNENVQKYSEIFSISKYLREALVEGLGTDQILTLTKLHEVSGDQVKKYLFKTLDGERIESVLMFYKNPKHERKEFHVSLCVSTQVGCAMGCKFCTTGNLVGLKRNLSADEIVDQVLYFKKEGIELDSVFFSGMGEPFANPNFFEALNMLVNKEFLGMGARKFSVSTVGIVPKIQELTQRFPQVNLALSLHFPTDELRLQNMPVNKAYPLNEVMAALKNHVVQTNRKVFLAYVMLKNVNDSLEYAQKLVELVKAQGEHAYLFHVNLIEFHKGSTKEFFDCSTQEQIQSFRECLMKNGISVTIRKNFGEEIEAACGQLYAQYNKENPQVA